MPGTGGLRPDENENRGERKASAHPGRPGCFIRAGLS